MDVVGFGSDDVCVKHDEWWSGGIYSWSVWVSRANLFSGVTID